MADEKIEVSTEGGSELPALPELAASSAVGPAAPLPTPLLGALPPSLAGYLAGAEARLAKLELLVEALSVELPALSNQIFAGLTAVDQLAGLFNLVWAPSAGQWLRLVPTLPKSPTLPAAPTNPANPPPGALKLGKK